VLVGSDADLAAHPRYDACRSIGDRDRIKGCAVLFCTLATASRHDLREMVHGRDLVCVDEAGQALESDVVGAADAARARRLVLCGDPRQLPPVVASAEAEEGGFGVSALERLLDVHEADGAAAATRLRFLDEQRRMAPAIAAYPNGAYYEGRVGDAPSVRDRPLPDWLEAAYANALPAFRRRRRVLVDCARGAMRREGTSWANAAEVDVVDGLVDALLRRLPPRAPADVAVISFRRGVREGFRFFSTLEDVTLAEFPRRRFYAAQVRSLERALERNQYRLRPGCQSLRVGTVDAFQGSEADLVVISCVRAPRGDPGDLGFVADKRRFNVALTRAKHALVVVGHAAALHAGGGHVAGLVADARDRGDVVDADAVPRAADGGA